MSSTCPELPRSTRSSTGWPADERVQRVYLDLRELEFMDSSGLRLVALAERRLGAVDRPLVLVRGPETVQRVFAITRMDAHLTFVDEPPAASGDEAAA